MQERASAQIGIYRGLHGIMAVPIQASSVRRFKLMEEDFVRLDFSLDTPTHFAIGDYIVDEVFGTFVITKEQMPKYNTTTGGYDYQLQFDAPYMAWANRVFMLTMTTEVDGLSVRVRKEASWDLTAALEHHAEEIVNNLEVLGQTYSVAIDSTTATHAGEVRHLQYNGVSIIEAMNMMAEEYECEWWVSGSVIHFGKCYDANAEEVEMSLRTNVEDMTISDNRNVFASKIHVYGSQTNVPPTYRKRLSFTYAAESGESGKYRPSIALTSEMFLPAAATEIQMPSAVGDVTGGYIEAPGRFEVVFPATRCGGLRLMGQPTDPTAAVRLIITIMIKLVGATGRLYTKDVMIEGTVASDIQSPNVYFPPQELFAYADRATMPVSAAGEIEMSVTAQVTNWPSTTIDLHLYSDPYGAPTGTVMISPSDTSPSRDITCESSEGGTKVIKFNQGASSDSTQHELFSFVSGSAVADEMLTIEDDGVYLVPSSFYVTEYDDPSSLASIGGRRLRMPAETGDFILMDGVDEENAVERVVVFDDIYPDGKLEVTDVTAESKTEYTEYEGELAKAAWKWKEYTLAVHLISGGPFRFSRGYILDNVTLQVKFLTPEDVGASSSAQKYQGKCLLAGMTFDVRYNSASDTFTIVRNDEYGAMLPNETLYPQEDDPLVLVGWNVKAIAGLGLIRNAELRLEEQAEEYMEAMEEGQFTFDCTMMSDFMFDLAEYKEMHDSADLHIESSDGVLIYVRGGEHLNYLIPVEGCPVCIQHEALKSDKHSRVIGYELRLDKPYDSPKYTIGETDRYSRLAQIEKKITQIS